MFKKTVGLVLLSLFLLAPSAFALTEFKASMTEPLVLLVDRTIGTYSYYEEQTILKAPSFLVQVYIDNTESTYELVLNTVNLKIIYEYQGQLYSNSKVVALSNNMFEKTLNSFTSLAFTEARILAGERKTLGCDNCYIAIDDLFNSKYPVADEVKITSLEFTFKGWFEYDGLPIQNAAQTVVPNFYY